MKKAAVSSSAQTTTPAPFFFDHDYPDHFALGGARGDYPMPMKGWGARKIPV